MKLETPHYRVKELFEDLYMWIRSWGAVNKTAPQVEAGILWMKWQSEKTIRGDHRQEEHKQAFLLERKANVQYSKRTALWRPS